MAQKKSKSISPSVYRLVSLLFLISGGTGLVYQVVWFRRFSHVWGSTSLAFAAVGASFLFGLGLGAYLIGRYADRVLSPLRWYGVCEVAIGLWALVIPFEIAALVNASVGLYARIPEAILLRFLMQAGITLVVIGPPCVLMGGTLPLLIRELTARDGSLDEATGWLYAINTFGAALGCYLAGFHIIPAIGLLWTNNLAALVNLGIGLVALIVSASLQARLPPRGKEQRADAKPAPLWSGAVFGLYVATTLAGCAALVLEMTWTRQLAVTLGGSTYAFTATLFVVLVGIALGSLVFQFLLSGVASSPLVPLVVVGMIVVATAVGHALLPQLAMLAGDESVRTWRGNSLANAGICVGISALLEFLPAVGMGILFPLFVHLTHASAARVGRAVGNIYAWNTAGSIVGASLTAVLLFPRIGTGGAVALAVGMYVVALLAVIPWRGPVPAVTALAVAGVGAGLVFWVSRPTDPRLTNLGLYMPSSFVSQANKKTSTEELFAKLTPKFFQEGSSTNVLVVTNPVGQLALHVNGKADASNGQDMVTQLGLAYFPRIFKPDAKNVLVIGFGSGCTSGRSLMFPGTRVTCCEIEPAVYAASSVQATFNGRPQEKSRAWLTAHNEELPEDERLSPEQIDEQARFSIIFGDGRTALQGSDQKYDLIISEPSNPWLAGVSNLFTREFFRTAREHLTEDGVLAQWIQTYNFSISDYTMIVRTLRTEFPHYGIVLFMGGADTVLLASRQPLLPSAAGLAALQKVVDNSKEISAELTHWFGGTDLRQLLMVYYSIGQEPLDQLVNRDKDQLDVLNTDLHLRLEFDAPLRLFQNLPKKDTAISGLATAFSRDWVEKLAAHLKMQLDTAEFEAAMGEYLLRQATNPVLGVALQSASNLEQVGQHFQAALAKDANNVAAQRGLARVRVLQKREGDALAALTKLVELAPDDAAAHAELAQELLSGKQYGPAARHFREALRLQKEVSANNTSFLWANNLAWVLATNSDDNVRNGAEALQWAKQACEVSKYKEPGMLDTLAAAYAETGDFGEARKFAEQAAELAAGQAALAEEIKGRIKLYQSSQPFRE